MLRRYLENGQLGYLNAEQQAYANRGDGMHGLSINYWQATFDESDPVYEQLIMVFLPIFSSLFKGYNLKSMTVEGWRSSA